MVLLSLCHRRPALGALGLALRASRCSSGEQGVDDCTRAVCLFAARKSNTW